jgi:hypothetical protein
MHDVQTDLLSYAYIEAEVDGLFRAYLETTLMEYARNSKKDKKAYWEAVIGLRKESLGFNDEATSGAENGSLKAAVAAIGRTENDSTEVLPYRYWFDVCADYWSPGPGDGPPFVDELVTSGRLKMLYEQARALKERIDTIYSKETSEKTPPAQAAEPGTDDDTDARASLSLSKKLLEKVPAPTSKKAS